MSSLTWWEQYREGNQAALVVVLKTIGTVKRMGIDTSPLCKADLVAQWKRNALLMRGS